MVWSVSLSSSIPSSINGTSQRTGLTGDSHMNIQRAQRILISATAESSRACQLLRRVDFWSWRSRPALPVQSHRLPERRHSRAVSEWRLRKQCYKRRRSLSRSPASAYRRARGYSARPSLRFYFRKARAGVAEIENVLIRQQIAKRLDHGQAADAGIENANRSRVAHAAPKLIAVTSGRKHLW